MGAPKITTPTSPGIEKNQIAAQIARGQLSIAQACQRFQVRENEVESWIRDYWAKRKPEASETDDAQATVFSGRLQEMCVPDLIQTIGLHRKTGELRLTTEYGDGSLTFIDGSISQARSGRLTGKPAAYRLVGAKRGTFHFQFAQAIEGEVSGWNPTEILMEGIRRADECAHILASLPDLNCIVDLDAQELAKHEAKLSKAARDLARELNVSMSLRHALQESDIDDLAFFQGALELFRLGIIQDTGFLDEPLIVLSPSEGTSGDEGGEDAEDNFALVEPNDRANVRAKRSRAGLYLGIVAGIGISLSAIAVGELKPAAKPSLPHQIGIASRAALPHAERLDSTDRGAENAQADIEAVAAIEPATVKRCPQGMVLVAGSTFFQGSQSESPLLATASPPHRVEVADFCLDQREVTVAQYQACSNQGKCERAYRDSMWPRGSTSTAEWKKQRTLLSDLCNENHADRGDHPMNCITWKQADDYCQQHGKNLPSESQWELAARGVDGRVFPWGDAPPDATRTNACGQECLDRRKEQGLPGDQIMYTSDDGFAGTAPVGRFPAGRTQSGLDDMIGNVFEWTADTYADYGEAGRKKKSNEYRVIRGGAFNSTHPDFANPALRFGQDPQAHVHAIGFRCAQAPL
jgi:formylglycine-generating enzyme required for sulfatase activity